MAFSVERGNDAVPSKSYRTERKALTGKLENEAAKMLAKAQLRRANNFNKKDGGGETAAGSE